MFDLLLLSLLQVGAALLLGVFFGLERRMRGFPDASHLHAASAAGGLLGMIHLRPVGYSLTVTMAGAMIMSLAFAAGIRSAIKSIALRDDIFAHSGADTFTLWGALSAGCACGTGDVRSVAALMLVATLVSILRPHETRSSLPQMPLELGVIEPSPQEQAAALLHRHGELAERRGKDDKAGDMKD